MMWLCPHHDVEKWLITHTLYNGLLYNTRMTIDVALSQGGFHWPLSLSNSSLSLFQLPNHPHNPTLINWLESSIFNLHYSIPRSFSNFINTRQWKTTEATRRRRIRVELKSKKWAYRQELNGVSPSSASSLVM